MIRKELFSNWSQGVLGDEIFNDSEYLQLSNGGDTFPNPINDTAYFFRVKLQYLAQVEIIYCSSRNGDLLKILARGQEGTAIQNWTRGVTSVRGAWTAGAMQLMQTPAILRGAGQFYATDQAGNKTTSATHGTINIAAGQQAVTLTNELITPTGCGVIATVATDDATLKSVVAIQGAGQIIFKGNALATGAVRINWQVMQYA